MLEGFIKQVRLEDGLTKEVWRSLIQLSDLECLRSPGVEGTWYGPFTIDVNGRITLAEGATPPTGTTTVLFTHTTDAGNVNTGETDLYTDTMVAGTMGTNGDRVECFYGGIREGSVSAVQTLRYYFAGTLIYDTGTFGGISDDDWELVVNAIRVNDTTVRFSYRIFFTHQDPKLFMATFVNELTVTDLDVNDQIIKITGTSDDVSDDIVAREGTLTLFEA